MVCDDRTRDNSVRLKEGRFRLYMILIFFFFREGHEGLKHIAQSGDGYPITESVQV